MHWLRSSDFPVAAPIYLYTMIEEVRGCLDGEGANSFAQLLRSTPFYTCVEQEQGWPDATQTSSYKQLCKEICGVSGQPPCPLIQTREVDDVSKDTTALLCYLILKRCELE